MGHSESGHHHVLESDSAFLEIVAANGDLYVNLDSPTPLRHRKSFQQHRDLTVPAGAWRVIRKAEFDARAMRELPETVDPRALRESMTPAPAPRARRWVRD